MGKMIKTKEISYVLPRQMRLLWGGHKMESEPNSITIVISL